MVPNNIIKCVGSKHEQDKPPSRCLQISPGKEYIHIIMLQRENISTRKGYVAVLEDILLFRLTDQEMTAIEKFGKITDP